MVCTAARLVKLFGSFWFWLLVPDLILAFSPGWDSRSIRQPFGSSGSGLSLF
jgi:hypothetical protein